MVFAALGPLDRILAARLPLWALATLAVGGLLWLAGRRLAGGRAEALLQRPAAGWRDALAFAAGGAALLALADGRAFAGGFFRYDDFAFVANARAGLPFATYLRLYHADHSLPLYRLEVWALVRAAGPAASAAGLAAVFNAANALADWALLLAGAWLLAELGARRSSAALFMILAWCWPGWGEFTSGFYTIGVYPQTALFGFAAAAALVRFARTGFGRWAAGSVLAALVAAGLDVSGLWVFPALLALGWALGAEQERPSLRAYGAGLAAAGLLAVAYHGRWAVHPFTEIERVQNPGAVTVAGQSLARSAALGWRLPVRWLSGLGGVLGSALAPPEISEIRTGVLASPPLVLALEGVAVAAALAAGAAAAAALSRCGRPDRLKGLALCSAPLVLTAMVVAARGYGLPAPGFFWPAKYQCVPYAGAALAAAFLVDRRIRGLAGPLVAAGLALWLLLPQWHLEKSLAITGPWHEGGRWKNSRDAALRRADFGRFQADIEALARACGRTDLPLPPFADGKSSYPYLEIGHGDSGSNFACADLVMLAPAAGLAAHSTALAALPPAVRAGLAAVPRLRALYSFQ